MYGLVFKDETDKSLNVALFNDEGDDFLEVYELDEEYSSLFEDLRDTAMSFVDIDIAHSPMAKIEYLLTFECDGMLSRELMVECYDYNKNPELIGDIYDRCTNPEIFDS